MYKYHRKRKLYEDSYDRMTVAYCVSGERYCRDAHKTCTDRIDSKKLATENRRDWEIEKTMFILYRYNHREERIEAMMQRDEERDKQIEAKIPPQNIFCSICSTEMCELSRMLWYKGKKEEVLFTMRCPNNIRSYKTVFSDGAEHRFKGNICPECDSTLLKQYQTNGTNTSKIKSICPKCSYEKVESSSLSHTKEEAAEERAFEKYRDKYCLSGQSLLDAQEAAAQIENTHTLFGEQEPNMETLKKRWLFL